MFLLSVKKKKSILKILLHISILLSDRAICLIYYTTTSAHISVTRRLLIRGDTRKLLQFALICF